MSDFGELENNFFYDSSDGHMGYIAEDTDLNYNRLLLPMLYSFIHAGESAIIHDPNAILYKKTSGVAKKLGYKVITVNFNNPEHSFCWNPMVDIIEQMNAGNVIRANEIIRNMYRILCSSEPGVEDSYWIKNARNLESTLTEFLLVCAERKAINFGEVYSLLDDMEHKKPMWKQLLHHMRSSLIRKTISSYINLKTDTLSHICFEAKHSLEILIQNKAYLNMFSQDDFSIEECIENKTLIYLITPEDNTSYHKLVTLFIKQSYEVLENYVKKTPYNKLNNRMNYVLKEFDVIPCIPDFKSMMSASQGKNIKFILDIHSLSTLHHSYQEQSSAILSNLADVVYLYSKDKDILDYISFLCGKKEDGQAFGLNDIQQLDAQKGEALLLQKHRKPCLTTLPSIEKYHFEMLPEHPLPNTKIGYARKFSVRNAEICARYLECYEMEGKRDESYKNVGCEYFIFQELVNEEWNMLHINSIQGDRAKYAVDQIQKAIIAEMKIVRAGMAGKLYSLFDLFNENTIEQSYVLDQKKLNAWVKNCAEWLEKRESSEWVTAFSNLLCFCIEYISRNYKPQCVDLYLVRKMVMTKRKDYDFFENIVEHLENKKDKKRLSDLWNRYKYSLYGEEGRFLERSARYLEHFIKDHNNHDNTPSQSAWSKKLSEDCAILAEYKKQNNGIE